MLNLCAVLLELCMPFCTKSRDKLLKVDVGYAQSDSCRLNYDFETCLAGGQIGLLFSYNRILFKPHVLAILFLVIQINTKIKI